MKSSSTRHSRGNSSRRKNRPSLSNPTKSRGKFKKRSNSASQAGPFHKKKKVSKFGVSASSPARRGKYKSSLRGSSNSSSNSSFKSKRNSSKKSKRNNNDFDFFEANSKPNFTGNKTNKSYKSRDQFKNKRSHKAGGFNKSNHGGGRKRSGGRKMPTFDPSQFINTNPVSAKEEIYSPKHTFSTFGLSKDLVSTITRMGITTPTPIQDQIIPEILAGNDVVGVAETGTGKTAAFLAPLVEKTAKDLKRMTLILAPTRELALQINEEFRKLSKGMHLFSTTCVGGMSIGPQIRSLKRTNHFIIGTPGRVMDLIKNKHFNPSEVTTVVLDEADRMLDMGFIHDMRAILAKTPADRETLFFSATMSGTVESLIHDFLREPVIISVKKSDVTNSIEQDVVEHAHNNKYETLLEMLSDKDYEKVIVFGSMKHSVEKLARQLSKDGVQSESIHGNKSHGQRQRALQKFKEGRVPVLVATDVAARGIHVDNVSHVINYDLPNTFEDYVHRIGRTGRGSKKGKALTFVAI